MACSSRPASAARMHGSLAIIPERPAGRIPPNTLPDNQADGNRHPDGSPEQEPDRPA